jgi:hypothetical protein
MEQRPFGFAFRFKFKVQIKNLTYDDSGLLAFKVVINDAHGLNCDRERVSGMVLSATHWFSLPHTLCISTLFTFDLSTVATYVEISWGHGIVGFTKRVTESELPSPIQLLLIITILMNHFCLLKILSRIRFLQSQDTALFASSAVSETRKGFSTLETSQPPIRFHIVS